MTLIHTEKICVGSCGKSKASLHMFYIVFAVVAPLFKKWEVCSNLRWIILLSPDGIVYPRVLERSLSASQTLDSVGTKQFCPCGEHGKRMTDRETDKWFGAMISRRGRWEWMQNVSFPGWSTFLPYCMWHWLKAMCSERRIRLQIQAEETDGWMNVSILYLNYVWGFFVACFFNYFYCALKMLIQNSMDLGIDLDEPGFIVSIMWLIQEEKM